MGEGLSVTPQSRESEGTRYYTIACLNPDCGYRWEQDAEPVSGTKCPECQMDWRRLAQRIKDFREKRGLSQAALAAKTGLSAAYLSKLEQGPRRSPSIRDLVRIARALGIKLTSDLR